MAQMDIITQLKEKSLDHVLEEIFGHFDLESIKPIALVSPSWLEAIDNDRIWKQLSQLKQHPARMGLAKNIVRITRESGRKSKYEYPIHLTPRQFCQLVDEHIKPLFSNWENFNYTSTVKRLQRPYPGTVELVNEFSDHEFTANYMIVSIKNMAKMLVYNRWTLELVKELRVPVDEINWTGQDSISFNEYAVNENVLVATIIREDLPLESPVAICVWDLNTFELLKTIDITGVYPNWNLQIFVNEHEHIGDNCLYCHRKSNGGNISTIFSFYEREMTATWIPNCCNQAGVVCLYREKITAASLSGYVEMFVTHVEGNHIFVMEHDWEVNGSLIQIRSISTCQLVNTIRDSCPYVMADSRGRLLVTFSRYSPIKIWDIATGKCVNQLATGVSLRCFKLISDRFIFVFTDDKKGVLWDLQKAIKSQTLIDDLETCKLWTKEEISICNLEAPLKNEFEARPIHVDEFQIVMNVRKRDVSGDHYLSTLSFLT